VRLVDLKSGAQTHALPGHHGAVLTASWSPTDEYILATGGVDGTVRLWDVRRSAAGGLGVLDMEDSIGITGFDGLGTGARSRNTGRAHMSACNGVTWTDDGKHIVSTGHDEKIRVWDATTGANTMAAFGPVVRNRELAQLLPLITPGYIGSAGQRWLWFPSERELLGFELFEGTMVGRLKIQELTSGAGNRSALGGTGGRNTRQRVTSLAWRRAGHVEMYSSHTDGSIRTWKPRTMEDVNVDNDESQEKDYGFDDSGRKRKRAVLDDIFHDLTRQKITFT
jgi:DNA excision repair protein ERCC-8